MITEQDILDVEEEIEVLQCLLGEFEAGREKDFDISQLQNPLADMLVKLSNAGIDLNDARDAFDDAEYAFDKVHMQVESALREGVQGAQQLLDARRRDKKMDDTIHSEVALLSTIRPTRRYYLP